MSIRLPETMKIVSGSFGGSHTLADALQAILVSQWHKRSCISLRRAAVVLMSPSIDAYQEETTRVRLGNVYQSRRPTRHT